jgi:iron complex outermembrane recepter protein
VDLGEFRLQRRTWLPAFFLLACPIAQAQSLQTPPASNGDLTQLSIENLMNVEVTSVSKKEQKLSRTAAAVFVITQEDIERSGATNIPDLLRMVPGLDVAQINGSTWAISARGLNGQFSNELLVTMDGRNVYTPSFGGVFWDTFDLPLENIERIEVIRGPGGTVWGENAVNGVVNIIQKKAGQTTGALVVAGGGNRDAEFGTAQYGGKLGRRTDYRVYSKYFNREAMEGASDENGRDGWHLLRAGFRSDTTFSGKDSLTVQGHMYGGREGDPAMTLPSITSPGLVDTEVFVNLSGGFMQSIWDHTYSERSDSTLMVSYDQYERCNLLGDKRKTFNADFHHHLAWRERQEFVWGLGYRQTAEDSDGTIEFSLNPPKRSTHVFSGFVQDEIAVIPNRLYFTIGTKLEHNTYSGFTPLPSVRAAYEFNDRHMVWAAISRAVRTPAEIDVALRLNTGGFTEPDGTPVLISVFGNPHIRDEQVTAYEAGYRTTIGQRLSVDLAAYYNDYQHQLSAEPAKPFFETAPLPPHLVLPTTNANLIAGEEHGVEIAAKWKVTNRWTLSPSYDFARIHMHRTAPSQDRETESETEGSDPHQHARIRSHVDLPHKAGWDVAVYFTDRLLSQDVPSYTRLDTGVSWHCTERVSLGVFGENLWKPQHLEFIDSNAATDFTLIKRSWYAKVTWHF